MRENLKNMGSEDRFVFTGVFERFGLKHGYKGRMEATVLLTNVCDAAGVQVADHLWFNKTKGFSKLDLQSGDVVSFKARVSLYEKGYFGNREEVYVPYSVDYKLSYPTQITKIVTCMG